MTHDTLAAASKYDTLRTPQPSRLLQRNGSRAVAADNPIRRTAWGIVARQLAARRVVSNPVLSASSRTGETGPW